MLYSPIDIYVSAGLTTNLFIAKRQQLKDIPYGKLTQRNIIGLIPKLQEPKDGFLFPDVERFHKRPALPLDQNEYRSYLLFPVLLSAR